MIASNYLNQVLDGRLGDVRRVDIIAPQVVGINVVATGFINADQSPPRLFDANQLIRRILDKKSPYGYEFPV